MLLYGTEAMQLENRAKQLRSLTTASKLESKGRQYGTAKRYTQTDLLGTQTEAKQAQNAPKQYRSLTRQLRSSSYGYVARQT